MLEAIYNRLSADFELRSVLSGGIYHEVVEISRQNTPGAFDENGEVLPCGLLKLSSEAPIGPYETSSRLIVNLFFYQRAGYDQIELARVRAFQVLHRQKVQPGDGQYNWQINHENDLLGQEDQGLRCAMTMSRYVAYVMRRAGD